MKKLLLIGIVLSLLILTACEELDLSKLSDEDLERITGKAIVCPENYMRFGTSCCLDKNQNNICDNDEQEENEPLISKVETEDIKTETKSSCVDECSSDFCEEFNFISCLTQEDGCKDEVNKGNMKGKCNVECLSDSDCKLTENCKNFKCEKIICDDECYEDRCVDFKNIACLKDVSGCRYEKEPKITKGKCGVECVEDSDCDSSEKCKNYECIPKTTQETQTQSQTQNEDTSGGFGDWLNQLGESLEELNEELEKTSSAMSKISECTDLCAGGSDLPVMIAECNSVCNQIYYYTGEEGLNDFIAGYK